MMNPDYILEVDDLTKKFEKFTAIRNVSFKVRKGDVFGIIGPNGSGKSTILNLILNLLQPTKGKISFKNSFQNTSGRLSIDVSMDSKGFLPRYSGFDNLKIVALIKGVSIAQINDVLELVGLSSAKNKEYKTYSYGMKQRLSIASALLGDRKLIILDEPTNGLDPLGIIDIRNLILKLSEEGKTVIVASHLLSEMEKVCDYTLFLIKGKVVRQGDKSQLIDEYETLEKAFIDIATQ